jgi:hypothetical protein
VTRSSEGCGGGFRLLARVVWRRLRWKPDRPGGGGDVRQRLPSSRGGFRRCSRLVSPAALSTTVTKGILGRAVSTAIILSRAAALLQIAASVGCVTSHPVVDDSGAADVGDIAPGCARAVPGTWTVRGRRPICRAQRGRRVRVRGGPRGGQDTHGRLAADRRRSAPGILSCRTRKVSMGGERDETGGDPDRTVTVAGVDGREGAVFGYFRVQAVLGDGAGDSGPDSLFCDAEITWTLIR